MHQVYKEWVCDGSFYVSSGLGHGVPGHVAKCYSLHVHKGVSAGDEQFELVDLVKQIALPLMYRWTSSSQPKSWIEQKGSVRRNACLTARVGHWSFLAFGLKLQHQLFLDKPAHFGTGNYTTGPPGSQGFRPGLELHIDSQGFSLGTANLETL